MPDLEHTLQGQDLAFLKMVADAWGLELSAPDARSALPILLEALHDPTLVQEMLDVLPVEAREALAALLESDGRMSWALFSRRFGNIRQMGAGKRDRERPDLNPISTSEILWYRALIGRVFLDIPPELQEAAYIPDDLPLHGLRVFQSASIETPPGRPATPRESAIHIPATDRILDDACTYLAASRLGMEPPQFTVTGAALPAAVFRDLLDAIGLLDTNGQPLPEAARAFLESPRPEALLKLLQGWSQSQIFNELRQLPDLVTEGNWTNNPYEARKAVMDWISLVPAGTWWSISAFVSTIHSRHPDFQRPAGDYDSWFIKQAGSGQYLRGFSHWDDVDGALIRYLICGPMHWLGLVNLAAPEIDAPPAAFSLSTWSADLWHSIPPTNLPPDEENLRVTSDGILMMPFRSPRAMRYQAARFCEWLPENREDYRYQVTPDSLEHARAQGLKTSQLLALLRRHGSTPLPPTFIQALERWDQVGVQARLQEATLLRVDSPAILEALRKSRASRWLGEILSPTIIVIKPGAADAIRRVLLEMGYLSSPPGPTDEIDQS